METADLAKSDDLVIIAALVSRVEAICVASMLEANGVAVQNDGNCHASVEINSLALGGHRLRIAQADYEAASDLIREVGTADNWHFSQGLRKAIIKVMIFGSVAFALPLGVSAYSLTAEPLTPILAAAAFSVLGLPVNPQGQGDYYLAPSTKG